MKSGTAVSTIALQIRVRAKSHSEKAGQHNGNDSFPPESPMRQGLSNADPTGARQASHTLESQE